MNLASFLCMYEIHEDMNTLVTSPGTLFSEDLMKSGSSVVDPVSLGGAQVRSHFVQVHSPCLKLHSYCRLQVTGQAANRQLAETLAAPRWPCLWQTVGSKFFFLPKHKSTGQPQVRDCQVVCQPVTRREQKQKALQHGTREAQ